MFTKDNEAGIGNSVPNPLFYFEAIVNYIGGIAQEMASDIDPDDNEAKICVLNFLKGLGYNIPHITKIIHDEVTNERKDDF